MSGWIKIEKDLVTDIRFLRMVKAARNADVTLSSISNELAATLVLGCLARLWIYADTHIREDDTLDLGPDEIDEIVGLKGFAEFMPSDWLEVIQPDCIKLPGFQDHNGTDAKKKALTQKRVARHRVRKVTRGSNGGTPIGNGGALPDQTRLDQTRLDQTSDIQSASGESVPRQTFSPDARYELIAQLQAIYPKGTYSPVTWTHAERALGVDLDGGTDPALVLSRVEQFLAQQKALSNIGTQFIPSPKTFFEERRWQHEFELPAVREAPKKENATERIHRRLRELEKNTYDA